jgi:hypothetical protein
MATTSSSEAVQLLALGIDQDQAEPIGAADLGVLGGVGQGDPGGLARAGDPADHRQGRRGESGSGPLGIHERSFATFVRERGSVHLSESLGQVATRVGPSVMPSKIAPELLRTA